MRWKKLGLIFKPNKKLWWSQLRAMVPCPIINADGSIRIFYSSCDDKGIGRISFFELSPDDLTCVLYAHTKPVLDVGVPGSFDENGVLPSSLVSNIDGTIFMYYVGFELGKNIRYRLLTGLAKSSDGGNTFLRIKKTPILERSDSELYFRGGPCCIREGETYKLWYVAGSEWLTIRSKEMPTYDIRYLESSNGINWADTGRLVLPIRNKDEYGFGRPYVIKLSDNMYNMFYSIRKKSFNAYRLGFAKSINGFDWVRFDSSLNLNVSDTGFDSHEMMYGTPIKIKDKLYIFYNGNNFGEDGIGLAELESN